jgi:hypothetical protein
VDSARLDLTLLFWYILLPERLAVLAKRIFIVI